MSLIQEALKRKAEDSPTQPAKVPSDAPAKSPPPAASMPGTIPIVLFSILVILVLLAAVGAYFFLTQSKSGTDPAQETQAAEQPVPAPAAVPAPDPVPVPPTEPAPEPAPVPEPAITPAPAPTTPSPQPAAKPAVPWPDISFSGTAAGGNKVLAVINGRMLSKGDTIDNITVLQIGTNKVLLEYQGEKRLFRLD